MKQETKNGICLSCVIIIVGFCISLGVFKTYQFHRRNSVPETFTATNFTMAGRHGVFLTDEKLIDMLTTAWREGAETAALEAAVYVVNHQTTNWYGVQLGPETRSVIVSNAMRRISVGP